MKIISILFIILCTPITFIYGQTLGSEIKIKTTLLADNIHMLQGRGGNVVVTSGQDGLLVIDADYAQVSPQLHIAIKNISDGDIQYLINTHWHGDHTGGNEIMADKGALIIAHENVLLRMSSHQLIKAFSKKVAPSVENARPKLTYSDQMSIDFNDEKILVLHFDHAHTDGDGIVFFPVKNVIHLGDIYFHKRYPFIDVSSGGSMDGLIAALTQILVLIDENTVVIPGHGSVSNKAELKEYLAVIQLIKSNIESAIAAGKTQEEIAKMALGDDYEESWGKVWITSADLVDVYFSVREKAHLLGK